MYDSEEEIKKKRKKLFIIIGVVSFLILLLLIILVSKSSGSSDSSTSLKEITCVLEVKGNAKPTTEGAYTSGVEVGFKEINAISEKYPIVKNTVGTVDKSTNKETYKIEQSGKYTLHGYVQDSAGNKGKCDLEVVVNMSKPTCELEVKKGTLGSNEWYRSDVEVGFKTMDSNNPTVSITKYYIEKEVTSLENETEVVKGDPPTNNVEKYTVKDNQETTLIGYVIDSSGNEGTCKIKVMKDASVPTCSLKVTSGTKNESGLYTDNPVVEFDKVEDEASGIAEKGIGISKNYKNETYKVEKDGKTTVVGYVKDKAGNEGVCSLEINKGESQDDGQTNPTCVISIDGNKSGDKYIGKVTLTLTYNSKSGTTISDYGLAETKTYNQRTTLSIDKDGNHTVYGSVKDSDGKTGTCTTGTFSIVTGKLLSENVEVGDYVNYDAGTWQETRSESKTDGYTWGYTLGSSRQTGVKCTGRDTATKDGWVVLGKTDGKVVLVHAGTPECIYHGRNEQSTAINSMNSASQKYMNTKYAESAQALSCNTPGVDCTKQTFTGNVLVPGTHYYLATSAGSNNSIYFISTSGAKDAGSFSSYGFRPVIILKADVITTGRTNGAWQLG